MKKILGVQIMVVEPYNGELGALSKLLGSIARDVKASRPTFWPRPWPRDPLTSVSSFWSRPRTLIFNFKEPGVLSFRNML